jgi:plastocyanin
MNSSLIIPFLILSLIFIGISFSESNADIVANEAYLVEGSGFAVTEKSIKISEIDLLMSVGEQVGSSSKIVVEDGFVTVNDLDFEATDITGNLLRDGRFIRLIGTAENSIGNEVSISFFGRLVENSIEGSIYTFTGRLTQGSESNKIIYTTKISTLIGTLPTSPSTTITKPSQENEIIIHILKGSSNPREFNYIQQEGVSSQRFYSLDRVSIVPGKSLTFINDDTVSHSISSGKRDTESRAGIYTADGRIASGDIQPGKSWSVTIDEIGFYALFDEDYPWMTIDVVVFPDIESDILRKSTTNPLN